MGMVDGADQYNTDRQWFILVSVVQAPEPCLQFIVWRRKYVNVDSLW